MRDRMLLFLSLYGVSAHQRGDFGAAAGLGVESLFSASGRPN